MPRFRGRALSIEAGTIMAHSGRRMNRDFPDLGKYPPFFSKDWKFFEPCFPRIGKS
jgi:hypothetical protein